MEPPDTCQGSKLYPGDCCFCFCLGEKMHFHVWPKNILVSKLEWKSLWIFFKHSFASCTTRLVHLWPKIIWFQDTLNGRFRYTIQPRPEAFNVGTRFSNLVVSDWILILGVNNVYIYIYNYNTIYIYYRHSRIAITVLQETLLSSLSWSSNKWRCCPQFQRHVFMHIYTYI